MCSPRMNALLLATASMAVVLGACDNGGGQQKVTGADNVAICHANQGSKGYTHNVVDPNSIVGGGNSGHDSHPDDVIPPFDYLEDGVNKHYPGKNMGEGIDPDSGKCDESTPTT